MARVMWWAALALGTMPALLQAQSLDEVDRLIRDGRMQDAREVLLAWADAHPSPGRVDRQRGLWFRGVLNLDPDQASTAFRRLVVEYPGGPYTDLALQRLAVAAALRGDLRAAESSFSLLARDYPGSPARAQAVEWLARNRTRLDSLRSEGPPPRSGTDSTAADAPVIPPRSDVERQPPPPETGARRPARGRYAAQLGAFSVRERADTVAARARASGFEARVVRVRGQDLFRVRVGRFEDEEAARALIERLRAEGFDATLASNVAQERGGS